MTDNVQVALYRLSDPRATEAANAIDAAFPRGTKAVIRAWERGERLLKELAGRR